MFCILTQNIFFAKVSLHTQKAGVVIVKPFRLFWKSTGGGKTGNKMVEMHTSGEKEL